LGDNGVGKSTILKAIAAAIMGSDARSYASRLVRAGSTLGRITLITEQNPSGYITEILTTDMSGVAEVVSRPGRPMEAEGWLALGFSPLRIVTWNPLSGPQSMVQKGRPTADDLMPLLNGEVDPRMDRLKQWIVNLDAAAKTSPDGSIRAAETIAAFFQLLRDLTDRQDIDFASVDANFRVLVKIADIASGVPIEVLSQGLTSLFGWIGVLCQRIKETQQDASQAALPKEAFALVLIDELDAHMHPRWQQVLVSRLKDCFPNVQFIACTHSPLIVGGLEKSEVERFTISDGAIARVDFDSDMTLGRFDQILTGELFGLASTLDATTQNLIAEYRKLLGKSHRSDPEQQRYLALARDLEKRIPPSPSNLVERRARELLEALRPLELDGLPEEVKERLAQLRKSFRKEAVQ